MTVEARQSWIDVRKLGATSQARIFFRMRFPAGRAYALDRVAKFHSFGSRSMPDVSFDDPQSRTI